MTSTESIQFTCSCGRRLGARPDQVGRTYRCPGCGEAVRVPDLAATSPTPPEPAKVEPTFTPTALFGRPVPSSIGELLLFVFIGWSAIGFVCLIAMFFGTLAFYLSLAVFAITTVAAVHQAIQLLVARQNVLHAKSLSLLWGTARLLAWDPTEGVLILRDKQVSFKDDDLHDGKGGVRFIYPILGEELALRVPLETQTLHFADSDVLTREYLPLRIRGTMKWRIVDVAKFYLLVSRELRHTRESSQANGARGVVLPTPTKVTNVSGQLVDAAVEWLRGLAEEQTRLIVSRVRSGLLIADRLMAEVPEMRSLLSTPSDADEFGGATEGLAGAIHATLTDRLTDYGLAVVDVSLQEIGMPAAVVDQCAEAAKTAYLPVMAGRQAAAKRLNLQAEADVIGADAMAAREVVRHAPAYALGDFLTKFVAQRTGEPNGTSSSPVVPTIDVGQLAAMEANAERKRIEDETK